jgi:DNA-binding MarR family transcriptional regulator
MGEALKRRLKQAKFATPDQEAVLALFVAASYMRSKLDRVGSEFGISTEQYNILRILKGAHPEGHACGAIAERMIDRAPDITRRIDKLVSMGLVVRDRSAEDRRVVITQISQAGLEVLAKMDERLASVQRETSEKLSAEEWGELTRLCERLFDEEV